MGIVGASGAGKTTFADTFLGLLPPVAGQILVDGEDIGHYSVSYDVPRYTTAPVQAGDSVGSLIVSYDGREVERVPLIADSAVSRGFILMSFLTGIYDGVYSVVFA